MPETPTFSRSTYRSGEVIFGEGDIADAVYMIVSGSVEIRAKAWGDAFRPLALISKGEIFGEMALIEGRPRQAAAVAMEKTVVVEIQRNKFYSLLLSLDPLMKKMVIHLAVNLRETTDRLRKCEES
jgi:CRP-like cAMP-binding protein